MSRTVDERVVEMQFDNRNFEQNVSKTMSTLDKLKAKLNLSGAAKGLSDLTSNANIVKRNMDVLGQGVRSVQTEFSSLSVIGATCLVNLTNSAIRAGKNIVNALTLDPIKTGFQEYETKIGAIQTILANTSSKGEDIESVTKVIDELNTYADKTIYNFSEMTRNIGTFTAAGVGLQESAAAIQGIANVAAVSGSTSQQASTAMYQLSQALAAGTVKLQDWNSVVNAGMGGQKLQDALKATAKEFGMDVDSMIEEAGSFRESLQKGWITADVLNTTLKKFTVEGAKEYAQAMVECGKYTQEQADELLKEAQIAEDAATKVKTLTQLWDTLKETAQSGWGKTWELILGDFEEAKEFFTDLNDKLSPMIDKMSDARNGLIEGAMSSNWSKFSKYITDASGSMDNFQNALSQILKINHGNGIDLESMISNPRYGSLEAVVTKGIVTTKDLRDALKLLAGTYSETGESVADMNEKLKEFQAVVDKVWKGSYGNGIARTKALTEAGYDAAKVQELVNKTTDGHRLTLSDLSEAQLVAIGCTEEEIAIYKELANQAELTGTSINELIENISKPSGRSLLLDSLMNVIDGVIKLGSTIKQAWQEIFPPMTEDQLYSIIEALHSFSEKLIMSDETADKVRRTFKGLFAAIDIVTTLMNAGFKIALNVVREVLSYFNLDILDVTASIGDMLVEFRDWVDGTIDVKSAVAKIIPVITKVVNVVKKCVKTLKESDNVLETIALAIPYLLGAAFKWIINQIPELLTFIESQIKKWDVSNTIYEKIKEVISKSKSAISDELSEGGETRTVLDKIKSVLAGAVEYVKSLDAGLLSSGFLIGAILFTINNVVKQFSSIAQIAEAVVGFINILGQTVKAIQFSAKAKGILALAAAIGILAASVYVLAKLNLSELSQGILTVYGLVGVLILLAYATNKLGTAMESLSKSGSLAMMVGSLLVLAITMKVLTTINSDQLLDAVGGLIVAIAAIAGLMKAIDYINADPKKLKKISKALIIMGAALYIMSQVLKTLSTIEQTELGNGMLALAGISGIIILFVAISSIAGEYADRAGKMVFKMAAAMLTMVYVLKLCRKITFDDVYHGINVIGAVAIFFAVMIYVSQLAGKSAAKAGVMLLAMSVAMLVMVGVMKLCELLDPEKIKTVIDAFLIIGTFFAFMMLFASFVENGNDVMKVGVMMIGMAAAMVIMSGAMLLLALIPSEKILGVALAMLVLMLGMAAIVKAAGDLKGATGPMVAIAVAVTILCGTLIALCFIDFETLIQATAALVSVMLALSIVFLMAKEMGNVGIAPLIGMALCIAVIGGILIAMSAMDVELALENAAALALVMMSLAVALAVISHFGGDLKSAAALVVISLGLLAIAAALKILSGVPFESIALALVLLVVGLYAIVGAMKLAEKCLPGAMALSAFFISLGVSAVIFAVAALLLAGALYVVALALPKLGDGIAHLVTAVAGCIDSVNNFEWVMNTVTETLIHFSIAIAGGLAYIAGGVVLFAISIIVLATALIIAAIGVAVFAVALIFLAVALALVAGAVALLAKAFAYSLEVIMTTLDSIVEGCTNLGPNIVQGLAEGITNSLSILAESVANLGSMVINGICEIFDIHSPSKVMQWIGQMLGLGLAEGIDDTNGVVAESTNNLANTVTDGMSDAAEKGSEEFNDTVGPKLDVTEEVDEESLGINSITDMLGIGGEEGGTSFISGLGSSFEGYDFSGMVGDNFDFSSMSESFSSLGGEGGTSFMDGLGANVDINSIIGGDGSFDLSNITEAFSGYGSEGGTSFMSGLGTTTDLSQLDMGSIDTEQFNTAGVEGGNKFMEGLNATIDLANVDIGTITVSDFEKAGSNGGMEFMDNLTASIDLSKVDIGVIDTSAFTSAGTNGGNNFVEGFNGTVGNLSVDNAITTLNALVSEFQTIGTSMMEALTNGINEEVGTITSGISNLIETSITTIQNAGSEYSKQGANLIVKMVEGISSNTVKVNTSIKIIVQKASTVVRTGYASMRSSGAYLIDGLTAGINSNSSRVINAARSVMVSAIKAAKKAAGIASPSKVFYEMGEFTVAGFVNALGDMNKEVYTSGYTMADKARLGFSNAISKITASLDEDSLQPTIRPVLDMSSVEEGMNTIGDMFGTNPSIGLMSSIGSITKLMSNSQNGATNDDVVSAINKLRSDIGNVGGTTNVINGITYDDSSSVSDAVATLVRAARIERRT